MNRRLLERVVLSFVCALALVLIPVSYSWGQQDQTDRNSINQQNQVDRSSENTQDVNRDSNLRQDTTREKSSSSVNQNTPQNERQDQSVSGSQTTKESQRTTTSTSTSTSQTTYGNQAGESREGLPATAGELPLLGLIGVLSLAAAAGTRLFAKSTR